MKKIVILGGKGTAVVIAEQIIHARENYNAKYELLGFAFDDDSYGKEINGIPVLDKTYDVYSRFGKYNDVFYVFSLYRSDLIEERIQLRDSYQIPLEKFITFVHPLATVTRSASLGYGNIVLANTVINPNVKMGNFNTFNSNALVGHDTTLGDSNFIAGHTVIGSNLKIGNGNFFGLNCTLKNFVQMGNYNLVGMAANVVRDVENKQVLIGNPAKPIQIKTT